jgi:hypothetical protein
VLSFLLRKLQAGATGCPRDHHSLTGGAKMKNRLYSVHILGNPNAKQLLGSDVKSLKDPTGKVYSSELYAAGQKPEGQFTEVSDEFPKPGGRPKASAESELRN